MSQLSRVQEQLNARLKSIYTFADGKSFDIREELQNLEQHKDLYSIIESEGAKEGPVYEEYSGYLAKLRERITFLNEKKNEIESANFSDIKNITLLLGRINGSF
ncbi:hypothetical protein [Cohnella yongneupensis]|uniref:Uncharacterized protein n=1 Tax=Cohnella yongneupensis TaxID=425006 RepID=A0ABW0QW14_9BACL